MKAIRRQKDLLHQIHHWVWPSATFPTMLCNKQSISNAGRRRHCFLHARLDSVIASGSVCSWFKSAPCISCSKACTAGNVWPCRSGRFFYSIDWKILELTSIGHRKSCEETHNSGASYGVKLFSGYKFQKWRQWPDLPPLLIFPGIEG